MSPATGYRPVLRRWAAAVAVAVIAVLGTATPALAQSDGALSLVHREQVQAGPYRLTAAFSEWPISHDRSLDIVFRPEDGIETVRGTLTETRPSGREVTEQLVRHPRMRDAYGLDITAFLEEGTYTWRFSLDGPRGPGEGTLTVPVGPRPGPPIELAWIPTLAVVGVMLGFAVRWALRYRPAPGTGTTWADRPADPPDEGSVAGQETAYRRTTAR